MDKVCQFTQVEGRSIWQWMATRREMNAGDLRTLGDSEIVYVVGILTDVQK